MDETAAIFRSFHSLPRRSTCETCGDSISDGHECISCYRARYLYEAEIRLSRLEAVMLPFPAPHEPCEEF